MAMSQTTYYWVGGASPTSFSANSNWNTLLDGTGTARSASAITDVLIIDGSNIGGTTPTTGTIIAPTETVGIGQLFLKNTANLVLFRGTDANTSTITIYGDGTTTDDLTIDATSSLKLTSLTVGYKISLNIGVASTNIATGLIAGTIRLDDGGLASAIKLEALNAASLVFTNGSNLYFNNRGTITSYAFTVTPVGAIIFQSGSNLIYQPATSGKMYSTTTYPAPSMPFLFNKGSNIVLEGPVAGLVDQKPLSNVIVRNNAQITMDGIAYNIDNLTIESGAKLLFKTTQPNPIAGNIVNNGTLGATAGWTSAALIMVGTTPQTIGGSGTFQTMGAFHVATDADVTLQANLTVASTTGSSSSSSICGKLNFGATNTLSAAIPTGGSAGTISFKATSAITSGSVATINAGSNLITVPNTVFASGVNTLNLTLGALVSGPGIPDNSYLINTSSGSNNFTISKPATASTTTGIVTITIKPASFVTANPGGIDGSIPAASVKTISSTGNLVFNGATTTPFSSVLGGINNLTINAPITTNKVAQSISGTLTLGTGNLTIRSTDTIKLLSTATDIAGSPSSSKYIISEVSGSNAGVLQINGISTAKTFPIGTASKYMPVTLTPTSTMDFAVSVFPGTTKNGTPTGVAFSSKQKEDLVDAVWTINRVSGAGDCAVQLSWDPSFEGSNFTTLASTAIGISRFDATANDWTPFSSTSANNTTNTITQTFNTFSPFIVGAIGLALPVSLTSFEASAKNNAVVLSWTTANEVAISQYIVEKSVNGVDFAPIGSVNASNAGNYTFSDLNPNNGAGFYRLKMLDFSGAFKFSQVLLVKSTGNLTIGLYPNPVANNLTVTGLKNKSSIRILNMNGQTVMLKNTISNIISLDVATLKAGIYKLQINNETGLLKTLSFVKQ
jgi:hypothetical protein